MKLDWPMPHGAVRQDFYTSGDDRILLVGVETWVSPFAGGGDDVAVVFGATAGNEPIGGTGSDVIQLCSIARRTSCAALGDGQGEASDSTPGTLVSHADALRDAYAIGGVEVLPLDLDPRADRIIVRIPEPPQLAATQGMLG